MLILCGLSLGLYLRDQCILQLIWVRDLPVPVIGKSKSRTFKLFRQAPRLAPQYRREPFPCRVP